MHFITIIFIYFRSQKTKISKPKETISQIHNTNCIIKNVVFFVLYTKQSQKCKSRFFKFIFHYNRLQHAAKLILFKFNLEKSENIVNKDVFILLCSI